jgi:spore germination cell wall hydrolase CwlJ-like protein
MPAIATSAPLTAKPGSPAASTPAAARTTEPGARSPGNQAMLRGLDLRRAARPFLARQSAPAAAPSSFATEVGKELDTVPPAPGADPDAPKQLTLKASDLAYLKREIILGQTFSQAKTGTTVPLSGEKAHDAPLIAEHFLCTWNNRRVVDDQPRLHPDPLFCTDAGVTAQIMASDEVRVNFTEKYLVPAYDAAVADLLKQAAITSDQGKVATVIPDKSKTADPAEQSNDVVLFAQNLHAEAALEVERMGTKALEAVAQVVQNRMACTGDSARANILRKNQFSWTRPSSSVHDQRYPKDANLWKQCVEIASRALGGSAIDGGVGEATHYFSTAIAPPDWANQRCFVAQVGRHRFFKLNCLATDCAAAPKDKTGP